MELRMAQAVDDTPLLVRIAPAVFAMTMIVSATIAWGFWGGTFALASAGMILYYGTER